MSSPEYMYLRGKTLIDSFIILFQPGKLLPSAHAIEREFKVIKALHDQGVPVPKLYGLCEDDR